MQKIIQKRHFQYSVTAGLILTNVRIYGILLFVNIKENDVFGKNCTHLTEIGDPYVQNIFSSLQR